MKPVDPEAFPETSYDDFPTSGASVGAGWDAETKLSHDDYYHIIHYWPTAEGNSRVISLLVSDPEYDDDRDSHSVVVYSRESLQIVERLIEGITYRQARDICCGITREMHSLDFESVLDRLDIEEGSPTDWVDVYTNVAEDGFDPEPYGFTVEDVTSGDLIGAEYHDGSFAILGVEVDSVNFETRLYRGKSPYVAEVLEYHDYKTSQLDFIESWMNDHLDGVDVTRL